jgi:DnaJ-class molecular chaperone
MTICPHCFSGYTIDLWGNKELCEICEGSAEVDRELCSRCNGLGSIKGYAKITEHRDGNGQVVSTTESYSFETCPDCNGTLYSN